MGRDASGAGRWNGAREEKRVERPRENRRLESLRLALAAVAGSPRIDRRERGERGKTRANANPLSRGSGLARRGSWCGAQRALRSEKARVRAWRPTLGNDQVQCGAYLSD